MGVPPGGERRQSGASTLILCAKELLEPMRPLVTALQGRQVEVCHPAIPQCSLQSPFLAPLKRLTGS